MLLRISINLSILFFSGSVVSTVTSSWSVKRERQGVCYTRKKQIYQPVSLHKQQRGKGIGRTYRERERKDKASFSSTVAKSQHWKAQAHACCPRNVPFLHLPHHSIPKSHPSAQGEDVLEGSEPGCQSLITSDCLWHLGPVSGVCDIMIMDIFLLLFRKCPDVCKIFRQ